MSRRNGPWTILASETKHKDAFLEVTEDRVIRPDGRPGSYATVSVKPGVAVLVADPDGTVSLVRQFRYALGRESLEAACGGVEEGEEPLAAARREAREELGVEAEEWTDLGRLELDTSIVRCPMALFLARGLTWGETNREGSEVMEIIEVPYAEAAQMVRDGRIDHAATGVLILKSRPILEATPEGPSPWYAD